MRVLLIVVALAAGARADVTRPAYLELRETGPGLFDVTWRVPRRGERVLALRAVLPESMLETSPRVVTLTPDAQSTRWRVAAPAWRLDGAAIRIEGPGKARVDTMVRFAFADGTVVVRLLPPGSSSCAFPARRVERSEPYRLQASVLRGLREAATSGAHWILVLALALTRRPRTISLALLGFLAGQLVGMHVVVPASEAWPAAAGVVIAAAALRGTDTRAPWIAALAGVGYGRADMGAIVGADAAMLAAGLLLSRVPLRPLAYPVGAAGVFLALQAATAPPAAATPASSVLLAPVRAAPPVSTPVAPSSEAPLQMFVEIAPFEIRVEWVARLAVLPVTSAERVAVAEQDAIKRRVADLLEDGLKGLPAPAARRVDFLMRSAGTVVERPRPVDEETESALVGAVFSYPCAEPPTSLRLSFAAPPGLVSTPVTLVTPISTSTYTTPPPIEWAGRFPVPRVEAVVLHRPTFDLSLAGVALLVAGVVAWRRGWPGARLSIAVACLVSPYGTIAVPLPVAATPSEPALASLVLNVYRSLDQADEERAYDRLGVSVTGAALRSVYLDQRESLELGSRGGARVRVESVEIIDVGAAEHVDGRVRVPVTWEAAGYVVHFGHRHFRQNRYLADLELVEADGHWKIARLAVWDRQRTR